MALRARLIVLFAVAVVLMLVVLTAVQMHQGQQVIVETAEQSVAVHIGTVAARLARDGDRVTLAVTDTDTGIGMTADEQARLFGEFVRIRNEKTRHILGSGLGLNILRKMAVLYGVGVGVESEPDVGSTFTVTLRDRA